MRARDDARVEEPPDLPLAQPEHTEEILAGVLGLGSGEIAKLFDAGVVAGP